MQSDKPMWVFQHCEDWQRLDLTSANCKRQYQTVLANKLLIRHSDLTAYECPTELRCKIRPAWAVL